jgi:hypothetical protein
LAAAAAAAAAVQVVVDRMFKRVLTFTGLPVALGMVLFPVFWYLKVSPVFASEVLRGKLAQCCIQGCSVSAVASSTPMLRSPCVTAAHLS